MYLKCTANKTTAIFIDIVMRKKKNAWARSGPSIWDLRAVGWCRFRVARSNRGCYDHIKRRRIAEFRETRKRTYVFSDRQIYRHAEIERGIVKYSREFMSVTWWSCARVVREREKERTIFRSSFLILFTWFD